MEHEEDRLSSMSKTILHNILSKLPMKDAARTSVLSKAWLETWGRYCAEEKYIETLRLCEEENAEVL
ncbi:unnamed protein product [Trifolium pratense]|uniref:Uncharacterized protein n=1 Tax=Trifolium pratense TaxID=57577 RepID=A0ACB0IWE3_TRIPR|nr:unnamed protein product [Trifolium pratense]